MNDRTDCVVVGASFAGMACALALAGRGARVEVLEKKTDPGIKLRTTGIVVKDAIDQIALLDALPAALARRIQQSSRGDIDAQQLDLRRREEDLAECAHPVGRVLARVDPAFAKAVELVEIGKLDLELQCGTTLTARQRHQQACSEAMALRRVDLAPNEVDRLLAIDGQHRIRKAGDVHGDLRETMQVCAPAPRSCYCPQIRGERRMRVAMAASTGVA
jgi:2-polyprenyl-6-methoxyphenol hydroxylase-like FAD-dependent oxidoreductase